VQQAFPVTKYVAALHHQGMRIASQHRSLQEPDSSYPGNRLQGLDARWGVGVGPTPGDTPLGKTPISRCYHNTVITCQAMLRSDQKRTTLLSRHPLKAGPIVKALPVGLYFKANAGQLPVPVDSCLSKLHGGHK
jgi:hypothetical protein